MSTSTEDGFYVVWREGGGSPVVKHDTMARAIKEAQRLARLSPGARYVVLQSMRAFEVNDMRTIDFTQEIPF